MEHFFFLDEKWQRNIVRFSRIHDYKRVYWIEITFAEFEVKNYATIHMIWTVKLLKECVGFLAFHSTNPSNCVFLSVFPILLLRNQVSNCRCLFLRKFCRMQALSALPIEFERRRQRKDWRTLFAKPKSSTALRRIWIKFLEKFTKILESYNFSNLARKNAFIFQHFTCFQSMQYT